MHLPPVAAVLRVSQLTTSPASSLWNVCSRQSPPPRPEGGCRGKLTMDLVEWRWCSPRVSELLSATM